MVQRRVMFDKSEVVLLVPGKKRVANYNLTNSTITRIQFDKCTERKFGIFPVQSEKITIITPKAGVPIVYTKSENKEFFDEYKAELAKYAKEYRVTFIDNTAE